MAAGSLSSFFMTPVSVIIGLGNPGEKYAATRHNVGFWLIDRIAVAANEKFKAEKKVTGDICRASVAEAKVRLFKPSTFMNESGRSVRRMLDFYKVDAGQILVMHDELDLPHGTVRLKRGGGHGGHNGLRDVIAHCGSEFMRLRIGIGHPGQKSQVTGYVLRPPGGAELRLIEDSLSDAHRAVEVLLQDGLERAMHFLHSD